MTKEEKNKKFAKLLDDDALDEVAGGTLEEVSDDLNFVARKLGRPVTSLGALKSLFAEYGINYTADTEEGANKYLFKYNGKQYSLTQAKAHKVIELIEADKNKGDDF